MPSTAIRSFSYDPVSKQLRVGFHDGGDYVYLDVPFEVHEALKAAPSKGTFVNRVVKPFFRFQRYWA